MADITPITREEFYLAKAGGQDVPVPSAVTREEYYLEKLSNDNVDVPTPVTRREKFLYFACGGEIDLPSEEKMTRLERLIAKAGGMDVSTPTAVTRLEKFWANVESGGWKTITGTLPLTFRTSETALRSWTIYGNNTAHIAQQTSVLPLTFTTTEDKLRDWEIRGNDVVYEGQQGVGERTENLFAPPDSSFTISGVDFKYENSVITIKGTSTTNISSVHASFKNKTFVLKAGEYTYSRSASRSVAPILYNSATNTSLVDFNDITKTFTLSEDTTVYIGFYAANNTAIDITMYIMLVKGSTAPSTYVPYGYEIPISTQGENLFDISTMIDPDSAGKYLKNDGTTGNETIISYTTYIPIAAQRVRLDNVTGGAAAICCYDANKSFIRGQMYYQQSVILLNTSDAAFVRFSLKPAMETNAALFGLNDYTFYIGNSPLTAGQSISKTSTGVDIATTEGENTISTTLYNKPETAISYVDYVGVGEKLGNDWQIPLTISDGTNTMSVNVPIDAPLTEGESVTDELTISTFEGANTLDTTLTNKPNMSITYKGG